MKAFFIHLSISALAIVLVLYFIVLPWYPPPHFAVNGGWQGVRIMLFMYFFLGPFLTLLLFKPLKSIRALAFDLTCILILQIGAIIWGVFAIHSQRPVGLSLFEGVVYPIIQSELALQERTPADLTRLDDGRPPVVYAHPAVTGDEQEGAALFELMDGIPEAKLFFLFEPIKNNVDKVFAASFEKTGSAAGPFTRIRAGYLKKHNHGETEIAFVPFAGKYGNALLIFNRNGKIIDAIPDPLSGN